jgi:DNA-directed RNA polymerase subunit alpha
MELFCEFGKGYVSASNNDSTFPVGALKIDALFSPVQQVSYHVEHTRIGQVTDYDKLIMIIQTNGSIAPEMAIRLGSHIIKDQLQIFGVFEDFQEDKVSQVSDLAFNPVLLRKVDELELSVRSQNCLKCDNIVYIGDLVSKTEAEMLKTPNFGRKSLNEIKEILVGMKVEFGMKIADWPPHNIEELTKKYEDNQYKFK